MGGATDALALACPADRVSGLQSVLSRASPGFFRPSLARALKNFPFCHFVTLNARAPAHPLPAIWRTLLHKTAAPYPSKTRDRRRSPGSARAVTRGGGRPSSCLPTASFFHAPVRSPQPPPPISRRRARTAAMNAPRGGRGGVQLAPAAFFRSRPSRNVAFLW